MSVEVALERIDSRLQKVETDVTDLKAGQARLETDVTGLKAGQARLEAELDKLGSGHARLETAFAAFDRESRERHDELRKILLGSDAADDRSEDGPIRGSSVSTRDRRRRRAR
jgi:peptidoglycan hydrolase CwlO-like protein